MNRSRNSNSSAQVMHNWLYDKFVASKTVTGETDITVSDTIICHFLIKVADMLNFNDTVY